MAESVDAADSKSAALKSVWVRVPLPAPRSCSTWYSSTTDDRMSFLRSRKADARGTVASTRPLPVRCISFVRLRVTGVFFYDLAIRTAASTGISAYRCAQAITAAAHAHKFMQKRTSICISMKLILNQTNRLLGRQLVQAAASIGNLTSGTSFSITVCWCLVFKLLQDQELQMRILTPSIKEHIDRNKL